MLHTWRHPHSGELRLYIRGVSAEAWISSAKPRSCQELTARHGRDWVLWVRQGKAATLDACPARLEVQSLLRAWLLRCYRRPLFLLSFTQLCEIAQRHNQPKRLLRRVR